MPFVKIINTDNVKLNILVIEKFFYITKFAC